MLGHHVHPVTLSGLSEDADVSDVGLATHVDDVLSILEAGDLRDVVVVGHLYSGIVTGQVADRAPDGRKEQQIRKPVNEQRPINR